MTMPTATPTFFPGRLSQYVPGMMYANSVTMSGQTAAILGPVNGANLTFFLNAQSTAAAGSVSAAAGTLLNTTMADVNFGRALTVTWGSSTTATITVDGWDYLGQPMSENIVTTASTTGNGGKCFNTIRQITWPLNAANTLSVGYTQGGRLGVPYRMIKALQEIGGGVANTTVGGLSAGTVGAQTISTADPRGWYTMNNAASCNGSNTIVLVLQCCNDVDAAGAGGLFGWPHFSN